MTRTAHLRGGEGRGKTDLDNALIIGIGNAFRGDDAVGLIVADAVDAIGSGVQVRRHTGDGASVIEAWAGFDTVLLVDAIVSGAPPGTVYSFDGRESMPISWFGASTHLFNVAEAVELARTLGRLPHRLRVIGIEGRSFDVGAPVSPEVDAAAQRVSRDLRSWIADAMRSRTADADSLMCYWRRYPAGVPSRP